MTYSFNLLSQTSDFIPSPTEHKCILIPLPCFCQQKLQCFLMPSRRAAPCAEWLLEDTAAHSGCAGSSAPLPPHPLAHFPASFSMSHAQSSACFLQRPHLPMLDSQQDGPDWLKQKWKVKQILFSSSCPAFPSVVFWFFFCSYPHPIKGELKNYNHNDNVHYDKGDAGRKWDV